MLMVFRKAVLLIVIASSFVACSENVLTDSELSSIGDDFDNNSQKTIGISGAMPPITSLNAANYPVSGDCVASDEDDTVTVKFSSPIIEQEFICNADGTFSGTMDLSTLTSSPPLVTTVQGDLFSSVDVANVPVNDQIGPVAAPTAIAPNSAVAGATHNMPVVCSEAGEIIILSGNGIAPSPQSYTCAAPGAANFPVSVGQGASFAAPNALTMSSTDQYGNPSGTTASVDFAVDTLGPVVTITAGANIAFGGTATFTVTVSDDSVIAPYTPILTSGTVTSPACVTPVCTVTVDGAVISTLELSLPAGSVSDSLGNVSSVSSSASLIVSASILSIDTPMPVVSSNNAANYPITGSCEPSLGPISITVGNPEQTQTVPCTGGSFTYNSTFNMSGVTSNPPIFSVGQSGNTITPAPADLPVNDQVGPVNHALATGPGAGNYISGTTYDLTVTCSEVGEVVSVAGAGLVPNPQVYTCATAGSETMTLTLMSGVDFTSPNLLFVTSQDQYGNLSQGSPNTVDVAIDNAPPNIVISTPGNIVAGDSANFTVTVTDSNPAPLSFNVDITGAATESFNCTASPCNITTSIVTTSDFLTATVSGAAIMDTFGNSNPAPVSQAIIVNASTLSIDVPMAVINSLSTAYDITGSCDPSLGNVNVEVGAPMQNLSVPCVGGLAGAYTATMDLSNLTTDPPTISATQSTNVHTPVTQNLPPVDTIPIVNAPSVSDYNAASTTNIEPSITCNEPGEVVSLTSTFFTPNTQFHTCDAAGVETRLIFTNLLGAPDPTNVIVASTDAFGNPTTNDSSFNINFAYPDPNGWPWTFTNGVTNGGIHSIFNPHLQVDSATSEGAAVQLYDDATCTNAVGASKTIIGGSANFPDIFYLVNSGQDGQKDFYAVVTTVDGLIAPCTNINMGYEYDSLAVEPTVTGGMLCGETSGPTPNIDLICEPDATVSITLAGSSTAVLNPATTTATCTAGGIVNIPLNFTSDGSADMQISQLDVAGNQSLAGSCPMTISTATSVAKTSPGQNIVFDNQAAFPLNGTCSHAGTGNVEIAGSFAGSPINVNCTTDETWSAALDYSAEPASDLSTANITITHSPGAGATPSVAADTLYHCRATATLTVNQNSRPSILRMNYKAKGGAAQIPIYDFGDGSAELQTNAQTDHTYPYTGANQDFTVSIKHCPSEIETMTYAHTLNNGNDYSLMTFTLADIMPAGEAEYSGLKTIYWLRGYASDETYGLTGAAPDPDNFPLLRTYDLRYHSNITSLPLDVNCSGKVLRKFRFIGASGGSNPLVHPTMGADCYDSIDLYDIYFDSSYGNTAGQVFTGPGMDISLFTSNISYYRVYRTAMTVPVGASINQNFLSNFIIWELSLYGGSATGAVVPDITNAPALQNFQLYRSGFTGSLPANHGDGWPAGLRVFDIGINAITGTITDTFLANAPAGLRYFQINDNNIGGQMPTLDHLLALVYYYVHGNNLDIGVFPDISGNFKLIRYYLHNNSSTTGPYVLPDFSKLRVLNYANFNGIDFTGSTLDLRDLDVTNLHDVQFRNCNLDITNMSIPQTTSLRNLYLDGNNYTGTLGDIALGVPVASLFDHMILVNNNLTQAQCDAIFADIYANRAAIDAITITYQPSFDMVGGTNSCAYTADQLDRMNGTGLYVGEGLLPDYNILMQ